MAARSGGSNARSTSTSVERFALGAQINLADSHARILADAAIRNEFETGIDHLDAASTRNQGDLEAQFIATFEELYGLKFPRPPLLSYSASSLASILGTYLGRGARIMWPIPSFDNIRDVVRTTGAEISLVPESAFAELIATPPHIPWFNTIWLTLPNNPTAFVLNSNEYARFAAYAAEAGITLVIDHCFRAYSPVTLQFDQYEILEASGCRYMVLEDTGKTVSSLDLKVGMLTGSRDVHPRLALLNENLLLNVSPFTLSVLSSIMHTWSRKSGLVALRTTIRANRQLIRDAYAGFTLTPQMHSTDMPVEWLTAGSKQEISDLLKSCAAGGLQLLPGASFFGRPNEMGSSFLRVALARDTPVVQAGAAILHAALAI